MLIDRKTGGLKMVKGEDINVYYSNVCSPDGKYVYGCMDEVYKVDLTTGKTVGKALAPRGTTYAAAITKDGKKLYTGPSGPDIMVWDTATMKMTGFISTKSDGIVMSLISK
jgi:DNA-binding beta-propeller fold protein YncE